MAKRKSKRWTKTDVKKVPRKAKSKSNPTGAPMCKLCGTRHWSRDPHHFAPEPKKRRGREDGIQYDDIGVKQ